MFGFCGIDVGLTGTGELLNKGGLVFGFCGTVIGFLLFGLPFYQYKLFPV